MNKVSRVSETFKVRNNIIDAFPQTKEASQNIYLHYVQEVVVDLGLIAELELDLV
jgi:hypothetical protein